jgi:hypothetical protein
MVSVIINLAVAPVLKRMKETLLLWLLAIIKSDTIGDVMIPALNLISEDACWYLYFSFLIVYRFYNLTPPPPIPKYTAISELLFALVLYRNCSRTCCCLM